MKRMSSSSVSTQVIFGVNKPLYIFVFLSAYHSYVKIVCVGFVIILKVFFISRWFYFRVKSFCETSRPSMTLAAQDIPVSSQERNTFSAF